MERGLQTLGCYGFSRLCRDAKGAKQDGFKANVFSSKGDELDYGPE